MVRPKTKETFMTFCIAFGSYFCGEYEDPAAVSLLEELKQNARFKKMWETCEQITAENNLKRILK